MKNRKINFISVLGGIIFAAMGIFLLLLDNAPLVVKIIAGVDILFGILLAISGFLTGKSESGDPDSRMVGGVRHYGTPEQLDRAEQLANEPVPAPAAAPVIDEPDDDRPMTLDELISEEARLRREARVAAQEADAAAEDARAAVREADEAERRLLAAEERAKQLIGTEQQRAFREVDQLAGEAMQLSQQAAVAKKRAKVTAKAAQIAAEKHSRAVDAAADAMGDDLDDLGDLGSDNSNAVFGDFEDDF